jgi:hypothetical protein
MNDQELSILVPVSPFSARYRNIKKLTSSDEILMTADPTRINPQKEASS